MGRSVPPYPQCVLRAYCVSIGDDVAPASGLVFLCRRRAVPSRGFGCWAVLGHFEAFGFVRIGPLGLVLEFGRGLPHQVFGPAATGARCAMGP
jgi:hypothetical protein